MTEAATDAAFQHRNDKKSPDLCPAFPRKEGIGKL
jgi:hypothetical protein